MNTTADWITWVFFVATATFMSYYIANSSAKPVRKILYIFLSAIGVSLLFGVVHGLLFLILCPMLLLFHPKSQFGEWFKVLRFTFLGRRFGNEIADSMLMSRVVFHNAIEAGGMPLHLVLLGRIKKSGASATEVRGAIAPVLMTGIQALEKKIGQQPYLVKSMMTLKKLYPHCDADGAHMDAILETISLINGQQRN